MISNQSSEINHCGWVWERGKTHPG
jgi:hypothetical protein